MQERLLESRASIEFLLRDCCSEPLLVATYVNSPKASIPCDISVCRGVSFIPVKVLSSQDYYRVTKRTYRDQTLCLKI